MIDLIELLIKFSLILFLSVSAAIVWQKRTGAAASCFLFALGAIVVNSFLRVPIGRTYASLVHPETGIQIFQELYLASLVLSGLAHGLLREGIRWLMFRFVATSIRSWSDGVMFGLWYSLLAVIIGFGQRIYNIGIIVEWSQEPFMNIVLDLNHNFLKWEHMLSGVWQFGPTLIVFNVGTSLLVLYGVRYRSLWAFLIAVMLFTLSAILSGLTLYIYPAFYYAVLQHVELLARRPDQVTYHLLDLFTALLALVPIFYLRKAMSKT